MSVVGGGGRRGSKVWRRERIEMTDPDLDDVAFLSGVCPINQIASPGISILLLKTLSQPQMQYDAIDFVIGIYLYFAGGDSSGGRQTRNGVAVCSQKRALCVTAIVLAALLGTALVIAYAGPQNGE